MRMKSKGIEDMKGKPKINYNNRKMKNNHGERKIYQVQKIQHE